MRKDLHDQDDEKGTIHVVDDDETLRSLIVSLMIDVGFDTVEYESGAAILERPDFSSPGCILLDVRMPDMSGLEVQKQLGGVENHPPIIMVTGHADVPIAVRAMRNGAINVLEKPFRDQELIDHVQQAVRIDRKRVEAATQRAHARSAFERLTPRERVVLDLVAAGRSSKEIASELDISIQAVDAHRRRGMQKLKADSVPDLVSMVRLRD